MINFSSLDRGTVIGRVLRFALQIVPGRAIVPVLQGPLRGAWWIKGASVNGTWLGSYEAAKQKSFADFVERGDVVLDVGANVGFYTLIAARLVGQEGLVIAMEPLPANLRLLYAHLGLNGITNVSVLPYAVAEKSSVMGFEKGANNSMGHLSARGEIKVRTVRLDDLFVDGGLPAPKVVKMDIEGGEADALAGGERFFQEVRPTIFLATHGKEVHARCLDQLRSWGYRIESVQSSADVEETDEILARPGVQGA